MCRRDVTLQHDSVTARAHGLHGFTNSQIRGRRALEAGGEMAANFMVGINSSPEGKNR